MLTRKERLKKNKRKRLPEAAPPQSCSYQRKERGSWKVVQRRRLADREEKAACSLAGKAYKSQATPPSHLPAPVVREIMEIMSVSVSLGEEVWLDSRRELKQENFSLGFRVRNKVPSA